MTHYKDQYLNHDITHAWYPQFDLKYPFELGYGIDYKYPHDYPHDWVKQQYLPNKLKSKQYYHPKQNGRYEESLGKQYHRLKNAQNS